MEAPDAALKVELSSSGRAYVGAKRDMVGR
jgi:hypothetical protein